jgi:hypothetical protein
MAVGLVSQVYRGANFVAGNRRIEFRQIQLTDGANYTTGGILFDPAKVGMTHIEFALVTGPATSFTGSDSCYVVKMHSQAGGTQRYHVYEVGEEPGVLTEVAADTDLRAFFIQVAFFGW